MYYRVLAVATLLCLGLTLAPKARADAAAEARKAIQAVYARGDAAMTKKDANAILSLYTPDYEQTSLKGQKITLAQAKQAIPMLFQQAKTIQSKTTIQKFSLKGSEAVVTVKQHATLTALNPQTQKTSKLVVDETSEDTWAKGAKGWLMKRSRTLAEQQMLDGKPLPAQ
jgi:uncharacterized protein (TIGR02246 family)